MSNFYICETEEKNNFTALSKARADIEQIIFKESKFEFLNFYNNIYDSKISKLTAIKELSKLLIKIKEDDVIYFQYPFFKCIKKMGVITKILKSTKNPTLVAIIHDIDSLRWGKGESEIKKELDYINTFDYVISHNRSMSKWLIENGCNCKIVDLEIFDYLIDEENCNQNLRKNDIVFAGNLIKKKSGFLYELIENENIYSKFNLYGPNFEGEIKNNNITYCGSFSPNELIGKLQGKFGLIWDGESIHECSGYLGNYTRYNNPHKTSMYISAELPIICWKEMAISDFVEENNIGICINELSEIDEVLSSIDDKRYNEMLDNIIYIKKRVSSGYYIKNALNKVNDLIEKHKICN